MPAAVIRKCAPLKRQRLLHRWSDAEFVREVVEVLADHVERAFWLGFAGARTTLSGAADMAGLQAERLGGREVTAVCGTHHHLRRLEIDASHVAR
jgi:hypothetical protein